VPIDYGAAWLHGVGKNPPVPVAGKLGFHPPLPQWKLDAIAALPMGLLNKIVMQFKSDICGDTPPNAWTLWDGPAEPSRLIPSPIPSV